MATQYEEVFSLFKDNITDPDLLLYSDGIQTDMLIALMDRAIMRCQRICKDVDLSDRDNEILSFNIDVPYDIMEIVIEWMTVFWLKPYLNNVENFRNQLNTKDFSFFSPANLLDKISNTYENARKHAKSLTNQYSYVHADFSRLES